MKKIVLPFMALMLTANVFVSCSSDDSKADVTAKTTMPAMKVTSVTSSENDSYLAGFYSKSFTYGESIQTKDENGTGLVVTKVIVDGDTTARGYVVNRTSDNKLLYFADFDKGNDKMTSVDVLTDETDVMTGLSSNEYYIESGGDVFPIIEAANTTTTFGFFAWVKWVFTMDHFWGRETEATGPCTDELQPNGTVISSQPTLTSHRVFWIRWSSPKEGRRLC